jgi:hypothetical protein
MAGWPAVAVRRPHSLEGACSGPEKLYPCDPSSLNNLPKADGIILLDSTIGAAHYMSSIDPAVVDDNDQQRYPARIPRLDLLNPANAIRGIGVSALGVRLYFPDIRFQSHTKGPHLVLCGDGTREVMVFRYAALQAVLLLRSESLAH